MYSIEKGKTGRYETYTLVDDSWKSKVMFAPGRGGIISSFKIDKEEILYMDYDSFNDESRNIRGGIPILFPICGSLENGTYKHEGKEYKMGNHGFLRNYPWHLESIKTDGCAEAVLSIKSSDEMKKKYPFDFEIIFKYLLNGNKLTIKQEYKNKSNSPMPMYSGFHPYFNVSDRNTIQYGIDAKNMWDTREKKSIGYNGKIEFPNEDTSKIILDAKGNSLWFYDKKLRRKISLEYSSEFKYIVIWSVTGKNFVCVEPWMAMPNAMNTGKDLCIIKQGESYKAEFSITCSHME